MLALKDTNIAILSVAISQDGQRIVTGSGWRAVIWDATSGREVLTLKDTKISLIYVALSPNGQQILSRGNEGPAKVWDVSSGRELFNIKADTNSDSSGVIPFITSVSFPRTAGGLSR